MQPLDLTDSEIAYLKEQRVARVATSHSGSDQPDVAAVGYQYDGGQIHLAGLEIRNTLTYQNVRDNPLVALIIDDLESVDPWRPRGIKIHGRAVTMIHEGREVITVTPVKKWSWGINEPAVSDETLEPRTGNVEL
jgi:pyridoxamine 5'-phosphate oxidase family protein